MTKQSLTTDKQAWTLSIHSAGEVVYLARALCPRAWAGEEVMEAFRGLGACGSEFGEPSVDQVGWYRRLRPVLQFELDGSFTSTGDRALVLADDVQSHDGVDWSTNMHGLYKLGHEPKRYYSQGLVEGAIAHVLNGLKAEPLAPVTLQPAPTDPDLGDIVTDGRHHFRVALLSEGVERWAREQQGREALVGFVGDQIVCVVMRCHPECARGQA